MAISCEHACELLSDFHNGDDDMNLILYRKIYGAVYGRESCANNMGKRKGLSFVTRNGRSSFSQNGIAQDKTMALEFSLNRVIGREGLSAKQKMDEILRIKKKNIVRKVN